MDKRDFLKAMGIFSVGGAVTFGLTPSAQAPAPASVESFIQAHQENYERILKSRVIRAAYIVAPPEMQKNTATGKLSGICHDISERVAQEIGIKIDWAEEVNFATLHEGLGTRYDALFFTLYRNPKQGQAVDYTQPLFYSGTGVYTRPADAARFTDVDRLNDRSVTLATMDGEMSQILAGHRFPKARQLSIPQNSDISQLLINVMTGKADAAFVNTVIAEKFLASHRGSLVNIVREEPLAVFGHAFAVAKGQTLLRDLLDVALEQLHQAGEINTILSRHEPKPQSFLRLRKPYEA